MPHNLTGVSTLSSRQCVAAMHSIVLHHLACHVAEVRCSAVASLAGAAAPEAPAAQHMAATV